MPTEMTFETYVDLPKFPLTGILLRNTTRIVQYLNKFPDGLTYIEIRKGLMISIDQQRRGMRAAITPELFDGEGAIFFLSPEGKRLATGELIIDRKTGTLIAPRRLGTNITTSHTVFSMTAITQAERDKLSQQDMAAVKQLLTGFMEEWNRLPQEIIRAAIQTMILGYERRYHGKN